MIANILLPFAIHVSFVFTVFDYVEYMIEQHQYNNADYESD